MGGHEIFFCLTILLVTIMDTNSTVASETPCTSLLIAELFIFSFLATSSPCICQTSSAAAVVIVPSVIVWRTYSTK